jgi:alkylhydroperoxidase family enzyme
MRVGFGQITAEEAEVRAREGRPAPNLQLAIANAPDVAEAQLSLLRVTSAALDVRPRELATLGHARLVGNAYCWGHHVPPALAAGYTEQQLKALREGDRSLFGAEDQDLLAFVEAVELQAVTDELWTAMATRYDPSELVALTMLVGCYGMISRAQRALDVPQDDGFGGFEEP